MSFAKLDSGIIRSSIWFEPLATRILWITMLAIKDENGFVGSSRRGLIQASNISQHDFDIAIKCLESPDPDSRTPDFDGRRIEKIDGGWIILNNDKYKLHSDVQKEKTRERVKRFRENQRVMQDVTGCNVTSALPSLSISSSNSSSESVLMSFSEEVNSFKQYPEDLRKNFLSYWTEPNKSKTKLRFQLEKTWDTARRLNTWASRDKTFNKNTPSDIQEKYPLFKQDTF